MFKVHINHASLKFHKFKAKSSSGQMKNPLRMCSYSSCSSDQILLFVSLFAFFLKSANSMSEILFLKSECSAQENSAVLGVDLETNRDHLLANLTSKSSTNKFYNFTSGEHSNKVYGLFLCNDHLINRVCQDCITAAAAEIRLSCPSSTEAIVWYQGCMLRYADRDIFSIDDVSVYYNILAGPRKFSQYNQRLSDSFNSLISKATTENSSSTTHLISIYFSTDFVAGCSVDCTPDIGPSGCNECLQTGLGRFQFDGYQVETVLQPSCRLYYFFSDSRSDSQGKVHYVGVAVVSAIALASVVINVYVCIEGRLITANPTRLDDLESMEHLRFAFAAIKEVTADFSEATKLGQGGFGVVYMGTLPDGKAVAVKRLSNGSSQGITEFKTEACLTARLQHKNLVKLFGFCLEKQELILVYEYLANKSLDRLLFDPHRKANFKWRTRYKIIEGLVQGLSYLHEDCHPKIIHRDLKPSNILLDEDMNPKIADFGIEKSFGADQTQSNMSRAAGTFGYMAPEYATTGRFSDKTDIFIFGVIVLELLSGLRSSHLNPDVLGDDLINYAWRLWNRGNQHRLVDPALQGNYSQPEAERCIHIDCYAFKRIRPKDLTSPQSC